MKLIKQLNEKAIEDSKPDSKFKYLDVDSIKGVHDILEAESKFSDDQMKDMKKLMKQYKSRPRSAGKMYRSEVGDDLEMLEYNPDEVESMVKYIAKELNL